MLRFHEHSNVSLRACRRGMATTEYVTVAAMIVLGMSLLGDSLRQAMTSPNEKLAGSLTRSRVEAVDGAPAAETSPAEIPAVATPEGVDWLIPVAGCLALVCGGMSLRNSLKKRVAVPEENTAESPAQEAMPGDELLSLKRRVIFRTISEQISVALSGRILVQDVMTRSPLAVQRSTSRAELLSIIQRAGFHHIVVVDGEKLCGIMSDHDIHLRPGNTAGELMTPDPISVSSQDHVDRAVSILLSQRFACLPVVDDGKVKGILTTTDLIMTLQCALRALEGITAQLGVEPAVPPPAAQRSHRSVPKVADLAAV